MRLNKLNLRIFTCLLLTQIGLSGCFSVESGNAAIDAVVSQSPTPTPSPATFNINGDWIFPCSDMGGGQVNQIFASVSSGTVSVAILTWNTVGCTGTYTLSDNSGNPVGAPVAIQSVATESVSGLPTNFGVIKITDLGNSSVMYGVIYNDGTKFYELLGYTTPHANWSDWLLETDVAGFAASPTNFSPTTYMWMGPFNSTNGLP